ncbi:MAG TPA: PRC-barrel domain-containing protein [Acidimicrobiales bacterium]|nr:PRC-barrel domain-containing protein [Acidimicrobiales bacterium]
MSVAETTPFTIGVVARCTDRICGRVAQVVLNPMDGNVTHLIVEPQHREGRGRLVPVEWVSSSGDEVNLSCTSPEFDNLEIAEELRFLPGSEGFYGYDAEQALLWPYFGANTSLPVTVDTLPVGEVAVQRDDEVHATDGRIGRVEGLVVDSRNHHATHLLLKEGHLFGRKEVAIPMAEVTSVGDGCIRLSMSQREVEDLPAVDFRRLSN